MKKLILAVVVIVLVLVGVSLLGGDGSSRDALTSELGNYFADKMVQLGVEDIGQPIEGFDSGLLILAFPGLRPADFDGVETSEGTYRVSGETVEFVRGEGQPITSAERMVSKEGYRTLLENVAARYGAAVSTTADVDALIIKINTSETIEARIDQGASAFGVKVIPVSVIEDSRCPADVQCIQAGTVRLQARLESGLGTSTETFVIGQPITTEAEEVTLVRVEPGTNSKTKIKPAEYIFYFRVMKR